MEPINENPVTPSTPSSPAAAAAVAGSPHPEWGDHGARFSTRLAPGWIVSTWVLCLLAAAAIAVVSAFIVDALSSTPLTGETNTELGVLTIVAVMATFVGFVGVLVARLTKVPHDRLANSLAVAALHVVVAIVLFAVELGLQAAGTGATDALDGSWTDQLGNAFNVLERSSAAAILASLLAVGMVPARGDRPVGTQTSPTPQDRQL